MYLNDFVWVSGQWEFQVDDPGHFKVPRHRGYIPIGKSGLNLFSFTSVFRIYFVFASGFMPSWLLDLCFVGLQDSTDVFEEGPIVASLQSKQ